MAEVEFVAVVQGVFGKWGVEVVERKGETQELARERLRGVMEDSVQKLKMQVRRPQDVQLRWREW